MKTTITPRNLMACGFTLIEVMIALALGMMVLAAVFTLFSSQSTIYKTQGNRVIASQDANFLATFISNDLRLAIVSPTGSADPLATQVTITDGVIGGILNNVNDDINTQSLVFDTWVDTALPFYNALPVNLARSQRRYILVLSDALGLANNCQASDEQYIGIDMCLRYDRETGLGPDDTGSKNAEIAESVTMFRVFQDDATDAGLMAIRANYPGIPAPLPERSTGGNGGRDREITRFRIGSVTAEFHDSQLAAGSPAFVQGYTILLEIAVGTATENTTIYDALGRDVSTYENPPRKRVIRYMQVYPMSMVP